MILVGGGELDGLKKKYEGYTNYGLLDEIRKLEEEKIRLIATINNLNNKILEQEGIL